jgi:hypothetical protein
LGKEVKDFIPTEEEFETILTALGSYETEQVTKALATQYLKKMDGLSDAEAFKLAFTPATEKAILDEVVNQSKPIRDKVVLLFAKVIQFRDFVREHQTKDAIEALIK